MSESENPKKRKADEFEVQQLEEFEGLANILNDHITTSTLHFSYLKDRINELQKMNLDLRQELKNCRKKRFSEEKDGFTDLRNDILDLRREMNAGLNELRQEVDTIRGMGAAANQQELCADEEEDVTDIDDDEDATTGDQWEQSFRSLRMYAIAHGHCKVPRKENSKLYKWIENQKFFYSNKMCGRKGEKLSKEKIEKLNSLGINWGKKFPPPKTWEEMYTELVSFKERMGHCNVPIHATHPDLLARWVGHQRQEFKRFKYGHPHLIKLEQIDQLRKIGFSWKGPAALSG